MSNSLMLAFKATDGKICNLRIKNPKADLTRADIESVMNDIIAKDVFETSTGASFAAIASIYTVSTTKSEIL